MFKTVLKKKYKLTDDNIDYRYYNVLKQLIELEIIAFGYGVILYDQMVKGKIRYPFNYIKKVNEKGVTMLTNLEKLDQVMEKENAVTTHTARGDIEVNCTDEQWEEIKKSKGTNNAKSISDFSIEERVLETKTGEKYLRMNFTPAGETKAISMKLMGDANVYDAIPAFQKYQIIPVEVTYEAQKRTGKTITDMKVYERKQDEDDYSPIGL